MDERFIVTVTGNEAVVEIKGAFKTKDAEEFGLRLAPIVKDNKRIVLNMKETEYICSGILREILDAQTTVDESDDKEMVITNANDEIMEVFEMTGFINVLSIE